MTDPLDPNDRALPAQSSSSGLAPSSEPATAHGSNHAAPAGPAVPASATPPAVRTGVRPRRPDPGPHAKPSARKGPARPPRPAQPSHTARPARVNQPAGSNPNGQASRQVHSLDDGDEGFFAKHRPKIVFGVIAVLGAGAFLFLKDSKPAPVTAKGPVIVSLPPLPPPPPPPPPRPKPPQPPPPQQQKQEKMVAEEKPEDKPQEAPKPADAPQAALGTGLKGDGPGMAGLGGSGNGGGTGFGGGGGGSKWGWYAGKVQKRVATALHQNAVTKTASMQIKVRIWADKSGRVTQAKLDGTTGDPKLDAALNEVLVGLQLDEPPPVGMPAPIVMRLTARRP